MVQQPTTLDLCSFGALDPELILRSLLGCDARLEMVYFRIVPYSMSAPLTPITCASNEDFLINLRKSLLLAGDDKIALRVNLATYADGEGLSTCGVCANGFTWADYTNAAFSMDDDGLVYFNIAQLAVSTPIVNTPT
jgi:hypothetical protein